MNGPILFCGDPHGQWQHIIDAALQTDARAVILLGERLIDRAASGR